MSRAGRVPPWIRGLLLLAVSVGLLAWVLSGVDLDEVGSIFRSADRRFIALTMAFSLTAFAVLPTVRWHLTLAAMGYRIPPVRLGFARLGSQPLKVVIPFKGGEAFRALWLRRRQGVPLLQGAASILFDMFLVAVGQLSFLCVGLALAGDSLEHLLVPAVLLLGIGVGLTSRRMQQLGLAIARRISGGLGDKVEQLAHGFLRFPLKTKLGLVLVSYLVEFSEVFSMYLCARALGVDLPLDVVLLNMPIVMGITLIPVTISGFGTRELAIVALFADHASPEALASCAILFTAVEFVLPALVGGLFLSPFMQELSAEAVPALEGPAEVGRGIPTGE